MSCLRPRLSLGPVLYYWSRDQLFDFYHRIADTPVDIVYLGETVCAKRRPLHPDDWHELGEMLRSAGKEVVLSGMALLESGSELAALRRLCGNSRYCIEANDLAAVHLLSGQQPFVAGPAINIYNARTLAILAQLGMKRWVLPVELSRAALADMQQDRPTGVETEVFAYGRLPLAYSARCFTARAHNLAKDECGLRCLDYPDGLLLNTRDDQPFLVLNGIQTQSAKTCNLVAAIDELEELGVDVLRISPQSQHTVRVIESFDNALNHRGSLPAAEAVLEALMPTGGCNGYWYGTAGMETFHPGEATCPH